MAYKYFEKTGQKDYKGKEIKYGDVIKFPKKTIGSDKLWFVKQNPKNQWKHLGKWILIDFFEYEALTFDFERFTKEKGIIIGNIFNVKMILKEQNRILGVINNIYPK